MINIYGNLLPILQKCMRISTLILSIQICCTSLLLANSLRAQDMDLNVVNASVKQVFKRIEHQANVTFVYDEQVINNLPTLTLHINKQPLPEVLKQLQDRTLLQFKMVGNYIGVAQNTATMPNLLITSAKGDKSLKITGTVRDATGQMLAGVNIMIKGTQTGTQTDVNGKFSIDANLGDILVFSYLGYVKKEVTLNTPASVNILLDEDSKQLSEIVVTALGIKKERKALGYSVTEVKGEDLTQAREPNFMNDLQGKVAGLNVNSTAGGPGASTNIIIRGISGLTTSQPLYVINGIAMQNPINAAPGQQYDNTADLGDAIGNLNPDDIESISILKGAAASALYGNRGKSGVILITTKSGKGNGIEFNSNYVFEQVTDPTNWQYTYGQGGTGAKPLDAAGAFQTGQSSYGGLLDGSNVVQFDGVLRPYTAQKNNIKNFYNTGGTATNTIAFNKSFEGGSVRFSASDLANRAITPNSGLNRQSFDLNGNYSLNKNFTVTAHLNYILEQAHNRPFLSDGPGNSNFNVTLLPTSVDVNTLQKAVNADGSEYAYSGNAYATNPWFAAEKFINNTSRNRVIGSTTLRYNFDNGYFIQGRAGRDAFNDRYTGIVPSGTAYRATGSITEQTSTTSDLSVDALLGKAFKASTDLTITPNLGASYRRQK
jgi:TonB-dependent SusC/RagA subfamily outer membrane receptor